MHITAHKKNFYMKDFFRKLDQIRRALQICTHELKNS